MIDFRTIIALWGEYGGPTNLHDDLKYHLRINGLKPVTIHTVRAWKRKNDIPYKYWQPIIDAASASKLRINRKKLKMSMFHEAFDNKGE